MLLSHLNDGASIEWHTGTSEIVSNIWQAGLYVGWCIPDASAVLVDLALAPQSINPQLKLSKAT
jgi:hypothetical protein